MEPLYIQAQNKNLGTSQFMDLETLNWIKQNSGYIPNFKNNTNIKISIKEIDKLIRFLPQYDWFANKENYKSIHGISHIYRVIINIFLISKLLKVKNVDIYLLIASLHDIRRLNDNADQSHGERAAIWFKENSSLFDYDSKYFKSIYNAIQFHEIEYDQIPTNVMSDYSSDINLIKAADALDRFRLPKEKWWTDINRIALKDSHIFLPLSQRLTIESEELNFKIGDPIEAISRTAHKIFN